MRKAQRVQHPSAILYTASPKANMHGVRFTGGRAPEALPFALTFPSAGNYMLALDAAVEQGMVSGFQVVSVSGTPTLPAFATER